MVGNDDVAGCRQVSLSRTHRQPLLVALDSILAGWPSSAENVMLESSQALCSCLETGWRPPLWMDLYYLQSFLQSSHQGGHMSAHNQHQPFSGSSEDKWTFPEACNYHETLKHLESLRSSNYWLKAIGRSYYVFMSKPSFPQYVFIAKVIL